MGFWILLLAAVVLLLLGFREHYVDVLDKQGNVIGGPGTRPSLSDGAWRSKIEAEIAIGADPSDYEAALQAFYDSKYKPARTDNPTVELPAETVEAFLDAQPANIDKGVLRRIILAGFAVKRSDTAAAREEKQLNTEGALKGFKAEGGSDAIEPKDGVDETWPQYVQDSYRPADSRKGKLSEGIYAPVKQQKTPRHEGVYDDKSTSWTSGSFYGVCDGGECAKNVL